MSAWYQSSFGPDYLRLYPHRDIEEARANLAAMLTWLPLPGDEPLLDLACGAGRVLLALRERGFTRLVGLDLSAALLRACAESLRQAGMETAIAVPPSDGNPAEPSGARVLLVQADMRRIPYHSYFATVLSIFTSFGYFESDAENAAVLESVHAALRPGGRLVIDYLNRERVVASLVPEDTRRLPDGTTIVNRRSLTHGGLRVNKTTWVSEAGGSPRTYQESVRMFSWHEMLSMLERCGFESVQGYGSFSGEAYCRESERLILVATKASSP